MRRKKFLSVIFLLSWLAVFFISGSLEQEYVTCGQASAVSAVNFAVMAYSGFGSGMLTVPQKMKRARTVGKRGRLKGKIL